MKSDANRHNKLRLTEVVGDVVRDVDLPVAPLAPQAPSRGAGISVPVSLRLDGDVTSDQDGLVQVRGCKTNTDVRVGLKKNLNHLFCRCEGQSGVVEVRRSTAHCGLHWLSAAVHQQKAPWRCPL